MIEELKKAGFDIETDPKRPRAVWAKRCYSNGYCASIAFYPGCTYGSEEGLVEVAVMEWWNEGRSGKLKQRLVYDTPITSDVIGRLTLDEALSVAKRISELPQRINEIPG